MTGRTLADRRAAAYAMAERLTAEGRRVQVLDRVAGPGPDAERTGVTAEVLARNGVVAIVPHTAHGLVTVRARHESSGTRYIEVCITGAKNPQQSATTASHLILGPPDQ
ncbi:hypothetical protein [Streptomyces sp. NPDC057253]|uniref:hypothetical protein n=1 Tax=Streptomyces sp. NPDC057253 TaxID=3346069 RepID=UPI003644694D